MTAVVRRGMDICGALVGIALFSPAIVAAGIAVKLQDGGPIIHRRTVLGVGGVPFDALKLRTMRVDADAWLDAHPELKAQYEANVKLDDDPRATRIGAWLRRTSLDEVPQFVNVLRGQMSLVGPRMIHPTEAARYEDFLTQRQSVRPGMTGLWQVSGRQTVDYASRTAIDREYLRRRSLWLDLRILLRTVPAVIQRRGAK